MDMSDEEIEDVELEEEVFQVDLDQVISKKKKRKEKAQESDFCVSSATIRSRAPSTPETSTPTCMLHSTSISRANI
jgi:hypothetical protein